jgi:hypothetical protein
MTLNERNPNSLQDFARAEVMWQVIIGKRPFAVQNGHLFMLPRDAVTQAHLVRKLGFSRAFTSGMVKIEYLSEMAIDKKSQISILYNTKYKSRIASHFRAYHRTIYVDCKQTVLNEVLNKDSAIMCLTQLSRYDYLYLTTPFY